MATTNFVTGTTITSDWLNDVDEAVYNPASVILPATSVTNAPNTGSGGSISATDVQAAIDELDSEKQPKDALLTALAAQTTSADKVQAYTGVDTPTLLSTGTANGNIPLVGTTSATESLAGLVELATTAEAEAGTADTVVMTALKTAQAIAVQKCVPRTVQTATGVETSFTFGSIPAGLNSIKVVVDNLSTNGTNNIIVRLGTGGVAATTGYGSSCSTTANAVSPTVASNDTGLLLSASTTAGASRNGVAELIKISGDTWVMSYQGLETTTPAIQDSGAHITLGGSLDTIIITTIAPSTNVFDAGSINVIY